MVTLWKNVVGEAKLTANQRKNAEAAVRTFVEIVSLVEEPYQQILYLRELLGLSSGEIARALTLSEVSVNLLFVEARKRFKIAYVKHADPVLVH
jgi:DNA-directed RNA polymerase specialized sigma24 family protein